MEPIVDAPQFIHLLQYGFYSLLSGGMIMAVKVLYDLKESVIKLNENMVKVIERQGFHEIEITRVNSRVDRIEVKLDGP